MVASKATSLARQQISWETISLTHYWSVYLLPLSRYNVIWWWNIHHGFRQWILTMQLLFQRSQLRFKQNISNYKREWIPHEIKLNKLCYNIAWQTENHTFNLLWSHLSITNLYAKNYTDSSIKTSKSPFTFL